MPIPRNASRFYSIITAFQRHRFLALYVYEGFESWHHAHRWQREAMMILNFKLQSRKIETIFLTDWLTPRLMTARIQEQGLRFLRIPLKSPLRPSPFSVDDCVPAKRSCCPPSHPNHNAPHISDRWADHSPLYYSVFVWMPQSKR
jgi:hypothetical protein